jgi:hypothetical protein
VTSDQGQAARPALGYRPPPSALRSHKPESWPAAKTPALQTPAPEAPPAEAAPRSADLSAAAWTIGHGTYQDEWAPDQERARTKERNRLARLRLYSYCMTLSACVLALMSFMYLLTGTADGDASFTSIGVLFLAMMITMLWGALRVTRAGEQ